MIGMATRGYEALVIFRAIGTEQEMVKSATQLDGPIKKVGGHIESSQSMGRRRLAFRIGRQTEGFYHLVRFQAPMGRLTELERLLRLNESIVRFMILSAEELEASPKRREAAGAAAGAVRPASSGHSEPSVPVTTRS